jgi:hypothetical protein
MFKVGNLFENLQDTFSFFFNATDRRPIVVYPSYSYSEASPPKMLMGFRES